MADIALAAEPRADRGSPAARRQRAEGRVPAVLYGHDREPLSISVDARDLRAALALQAGGSVLFNLRVDGEEHLAIAREVQRHPVRHTVAHVDFQLVRRDEIVPADVAIQLVGEALQVTRAGGVVEHVLTTVHLRAKPADIPAAIEIDVSGLAPGETIRVGDLRVPAGVTLEADDDTPVVVGGTPHGAAGAEAEEAPVVAAGEVEVAPTAEGEAVAEAAADEES